MEYGELFLAPEDQPPVGASFLMPLRDGRFGLCRVLRHDRGDAPFVEGSVLVACCPWIGEGPPANLGDPALRALLPSIGEGGVFWVEEPVPEAFTLLGPIEPTEDETSLQTHQTETWSAAPRQVLLAWRQEHDREALEAELEEARRTAPEREEQWKRDWEEMERELSDEMRSRLSELRECLSLREHEDPALREFAQGFDEVLDRIEALDLLSPETIGAVLAEWSLLVTSGDVDRETLKRLGRHARVMGVALGFDPCMSLRALSRPS
jgi:hypothetical protein